MILKAIVLFLVVMLVLGMFGKLRFGKKRLPPPAARPKVADARKCPRCGAYVLGQGPCSCDKRT